MNTSLIPKRIRCRCPSRIRGSLQSPSPPLGECRNSMKTSARSTMISWKIPMVQARGPGYKSICHNELSQSRISLVQCSSTKEPLNFTVAPAAKRWLFRPIFIQEMIRRLSSKGLSLHCILSFYSRRIGYMDAIQRTC